MKRNDDRSIDNIPPVRASFVLRCTIGSEHTIIAQLLDVRTGNEYPFSDLSMLPGMLERLLEPLVYKQQGKRTCDKT